MARLLVKTEGLGIQALELRLGVNHVGRDSDCEQHLNHHTVSSLHCELALTHDGVYLRDCDSTNGTFINGEPVKEAWLMPGQKLKLGDVELFVESTDATIAIPQIQPEIVAPKVIQENGELFCAQHPDRKITFKCTHCTEVMCNACVHVMRRKGGQPLYLCRVCSYKCERIEIVQPTKKKSFFGILQETVRLKFGGRPKD
ncbi:MAG TPA: FHA domain-containing protein [Verrucomicrobiae bacterium]